MATHRSTKRTIIDININFSVNLKTNYVRECSIERRKFKFILKNINVALKHVRWVIIIVR